MKKLLSFTFILFTMLSFAQDDLKAPLNQFARVNLGLHGFELTYELPISNSLVWENSFGAGMGSYTADNSINYRFYLDNPVPYLASELKFHYNREKRTNKGRSTINNSGNYIGLQTKYSFGDDRTFRLNKTLLTELHWGIQRPLGERFIFDLHIGIGYLSDFEFKQGNLSPTFGLRFGYKLF